MKKYLSTEELHTIFSNCNQKITTDTRKLENGSVFFALKGDNFDANTFAQKAINGGCKYAIVDNEQISNNENILLVENVLVSLQALAKFHRHKLKTLVIGITGSNGKTTNKELIHSVLSKKYKTYATIGNLNNHIGVPLTLLALTDEHEIAIVEMGANHQGEIAMLSELSDPDYGVITNIGKAHLEGFGGEEGVKKGKGELYRYLERKKGEIFINGDDNVLQELGDSLIKIYYGESLEFDVYGKQFSNSEFVEFKWNIKNKELVNQPLVKTNMFGHYNFINLLCAACIGNYFKVAEHDINSALEAYIPEMNRSQVKKTKENIIILDAYNANPSSMFLAIDNFQNKENLHKILILGDMFELGNYSRLEHQKILNQILMQSFEKVILVGLQFYEHKDSFPQFSFYPSIDILKVFLNTNKISASTILIKGSRGMKLEQLVDFL